jgi:tRNA(Arg) A34 adenosine deaminase TadA
VKPLDDESIMRTLQETLLRKIRSGEACGPFYAAVVDAAGVVVAAAANRVVASGCSHAHAEMEAIAAAERALGTWSLAGRGLSLYATAAPCLMCVGGILWSGLERLVYGATTEDVERLTGFDEGFKPGWRAAFGARGISVTGPVLPALGASVLAEYRDREGVIYAPRRGVSAK